MTQEEKIEGNKLIAEFMDIETTLHDCNVFYRFGCYLKDVSVLEYHSSWNWLMPVVEKIKQLKIEEFGKKKPIMSALMDVDIEPLYQAVIEFIKWHKTQPNER